MIVSEIERRGAGASLATSANSFDLLCRRIRYDSIATPATSDCLFLVMSPRANASPPSLPLPAPAFRRMSGSGTFGALVQAGFMILDTESQFMFDWVTRNDSMVVDGKSVIVGWGLTRYHEVKTFMRWEPRQLRCHQWPSQRKCARFVIESMEIFLWAVEWVIIGFLHHQRQRYSSTPFTPSLPPPLFFFSSSRFLSFSSFFSLSLFAHTHNRIAQARIGLVTWTRSFCF